MAYITQRWRDRALEALLENKGKLLEALVEAWNRELTPLLNAMRAELNRLGGDIKAETGDYSVLRTDREVYGDATDGPLVFTLVPAEDVADQHFFFKKTDPSGNAVSLDAGTETIDGATTYPLAAQYDAVEISSDGTSYNIVFKYP